MAKNSDTSKRDAEKQQSAEERKSMAGAAAEGEGNGSDGAENETGDINTADVIASVTALIKEGGFEDAELKALQAEISLAIGPGGANEGGSQSEIQKPVSDGPQSESSDSPLVIDFDLTSAIDEGEIGAMLELMTIDAPVTKSAGELSDKEIAAELKSIGNPLETVQECNTLWVKMKKAAEEEAEKARKILNLLVHKRTLLEEACMKLQHRGNLLREEIARRDKAAAKAASEKKTKK